MRVDEKPVWVFPGSAPRLDTKPYINVAPVAFCSAVALLAIPAVCMTMLWHPLPLLPLPTNNREAIFHVKMFYEMWGGRFVPALRGANYFQYQEWIHWLAERGELGLLGFRWLISGAAAALGSFFVAKTVAKPVYKEVQKRGRVLREGRDAYDTLKRVFDTIIANTGGKESFIFETEPGFLPTDPATWDLPYKQRLMMPDFQRRMHQLVVAGTRRGKTQKILKMLFDLIRRDGMGEVIKCLIVDTPKRDYSKFLRPEQMVMMAPTDAKGVAWHSAKDLNLKAKAEQFWLGQIPQDEKNPFFSETARSVGCGAMVALINTCGEDWTLANVVYNLKLPMDELEALYRKHYHEVIRLVEMEGQTLSTVMGSNEAFTKPLLQLAEIWDGYQYKHDIAQMSVKLLQDKYTENQDLFCNSLLPLYDKQKAKDGVFPPIVEHHWPFLLLRSIVRALNKEGSWTWADMVDLLKKPYREILMFAATAMTVAEMEVFLPVPSINVVIDAWNKLKSEIANLTLQSDQHAVTFAYNAAQGPGGTDKTAALILTAMFRQADLKDCLPKLKDMLTDFTENGPRRLFKTVLTNLDDAQLSSFYGFDDHKTLLEKCLPIFQWHQTWDSFENKPKFSVGDWLVDENPEKKFLVFQTSGSMSNLTTPLVRGMLGYIRSIVDDDNYLDDKDLGITRQFHMILDEVQALGDIKDFIAAMFERAASRGITITIACQDLAQLEAIPAYGPKFIDFLLGNTGNIYFVGNNQGRTAQMISDTLGKKWIDKLHTSTSHSDGKQTVSMNMQEHDGVVITPDEINEKLGLDVMKIQRVSWLDKLMGRKPSPPVINYLYVPGNVKDAFILSTPVCSYPVRSGPDKPDWMDPKKNPKPAAIDIEALLKGSKTAELKVVERPPEESALNKWVDDAAFVSSSDSLTASSEVAMLADPIEDAQNDAQPSPARDRAREDIQRRMEEFKARKSAAKEA